MSLIALLDIFPFKCHRYNTLFQLTGQGQNGHYGVRDLIGQDESLQNTTSTM